MPNSMTVVPPSGLRGRVVWGWRRQQSGGNSGRIIDRSAEAQPYRVESSGKSSSRNSPVRPAAGLGQRHFGLAQLHAADFSGDGLRQVPERDPSHALERRQRGAQMGKDRPRRLGCRLMPRCQRDEGFRDVHAHRVGRRNDRGLGHRGVLDQRAFQLERADPVVGRFEHVIRPPDIGIVAVRIAGRDVAGAVGQVVAVLTPSGANEPSSAW